MAAFNADHVFSQIVTIAKSSVGKHERCRREVQRIDQFIVDVDRSGHPREISDRNRDRLSEMLRLAATGHTLSAEQKAVFVEALNQLTESCQFEALKP
jgi:hypothetical protein